MTSPNTVHKDHDRLIKLEIQMTENQRTTENSLSDIKKEIIYVGSDLKKFTESYDNTVGRLRDRMTELEMLFKARESEDERRTKRTSLMITIIAIVVALFTGMLYTIVHLFITGRP